jgi:NCS1 family nucleobase:cation symporter-1
MLTAVFGHKYKNWDPAVPASAGTDAQTMLTYFLAWGIALPLTLVHPSRLRKIFSTRAVIAGCAFFAMFSECLICNHSI